MLHPIYHAPGTVVSLPEISGVLGISETSFKVLEAFEGGMGICLHLAAPDGGLHLALKSPRPELISDRDSTARFADELQVWMAASACSMVAEALAVVSINSLPCVCATWMTGGDYAPKIGSLSATQHHINLLRVVRGLRWVYEHLGVIHRDLKPQNLLLDSANLAFIADWGLSRPVAEQLRHIKPSNGEGTPDRLDRTAVGSFMGTVLYAAPEQIKGTKDIDFRADVYALGCIMFEMETGSPPFLGVSRDVVAYHHLHTAPAKLGGLFRKTKLGLENVVARCLQKEPANRYSSYAELEQALTAIVGTTYATLQEALVQERYRRNVIGHGNLNHAIRETSVIGAKGYAVMDFDEIFQHAKEAESLIALSRFAEARAVLEQLYVPESIAMITEWCGFHVIANNLALCITSIDECQHEAVEILDRLSRLRGKPAEYYVNHSLALLRISRYSEAKQVCQHGLQHFPADVGILGNRTIALKNLGDLDGALQSALERLRVRRDTNGLEETAAVLMTWCRANWGKDLPAAIAKAQLAVDLLNEGLEISPENGPLKYNKLELLRLVGQSAPAAQLCQDLIEGESSHLAVRHAAFFSLVEILAETKNQKDALNEIKEHAARCTTQGFAERFRCLENRVLAEHFMIGRNDASGARVLLREPVDFFLREGVENGKYKYPIIAAKILEWMNRRDEAVEALKQELEINEQSWDVANCMAQFLSRWKRHGEAIPWADHLISVGPWKAESYDTASFVYQQAGDTEKADDLKTEGDRIFAEETRLREAFRESL